MSVRPAAPGPQLGAGRLRVDAARAIKKLREYQLTDRAAWVLEGIRAGVASGATKLSLRGDANDIWLEWQGPAWDPALLPRLFDELVSPEPLAELQHARLLAAAVNSALGMNPAYVDIYAITGAGTAQKVRYTPEVLAEPENELGEAALRHVAVESAAPPSELATGMLVHLRRRMSIDVIKYLMGEPPELGVARLHCGDIAVPIEIGEHTYHRERNSDVLRLPLGEGLDGYIAVTDSPIRQWAVFEVAERGVVLARYKLDMLGYEPRGVVPIRVFLDADRLPTNASRSQVRQDVHPVSTAERRSAKLLEPLVAALAEKAKSSEPARKAALKLLASNVAGHPSGWASCEKVLDPIADLPLLRTAFGEERTARNAWRDYIWTANKPLDADLKQWMGEILWISEDNPARPLLGEVVPDKRAMAQLARTARRQRRAHQKFLAHAVRELRVQTSEAPRVRYELGTPVEGTCVSDTVFNDIRGELVVYFGGRDAALVVLLEGRQLERIELESPIPFDAVIDGKWVSPGDNYRGVKRDHAYKDVERAMNCAVIRAIEQLIVLTNQVSPGHWELLGDPTIDHDVYLVRRAIELATSLQIQLSGPLVDAPAWVTAQGERVSLAQLRKWRVLGAVSDDAFIAPPEGRMIVRANPHELQLLRKLVTARVVSYEKANGVTARVTPEKLVKDLRCFTSAATLGFTDDDGKLVGAIGLANAATIELRHMGISIGHHPYKFKYTPVAIAVDSDKILPNDSWTATTEDHGLTGRDYSQWELRLLVAIALAIVGERPAAYGGPERAALDDENGKRLVHVLMNHDPETVLGEPILEKLKAAQLFALLGSNETYSIDYIAARYPAGIPYVGSDAKPIDDFAPLVASASIAQLISRLAGVSIFDGRPELTRRLRQQVFQSRIAQHMERPEQPMKLPDGMLSVPVTGHAAKGSVGIGGSMFEIRVFVGNRPFAVFHPKQPLPLMAVVEVDATRCNETFEELTPIACETITNDVLDAVPGLFEMLAKQYPEQLGQGPALELLGMWLEHSPPLAAEVRKAIGAARAFRAIQGQRLSIAEAAEPRSYVRTATWVGEWLGPGDGEPESDLDDPILSVSGPKDPIHALVEVLKFGTSDVTSEVSRLQARRRMARGLIPTPKIGGVDPALKRDLKFFGETGAKLGLGEIGLLHIDQSSVLLHEQGELKRTIALDVQPAIQLAIEDPHEHYNLEELRRLVQQLALDLLHAVLTAGTPLPQPAVRSVARAALANRVPPSLIETLPLFQTIENTWVTWREFRAQMEKYENVWAMASTHALPGKPLDPERIVILLDSADIDLAVQNGHVVIGAKFELELDAKARANQARPKAVSLELLSHDGVLAEVELPGDGKSGPRGVVAVLDPANAHMRGAFVYRDMHPLGRVDDVCRWPTITMLDDARIVPDRTWSAPTQDETWQAIAKQIRTASDEALAELGDIPAHAIAHIRITNVTYADSKAMRHAPDAMIRGALWLTGVPYTRASISVRTARGTQQFTPANGLAIEGRVFVHGADKLKLEDALEQLAGICHGKLVRSLVKSDYPNQDVTAAHAAHALALGTVKPTELAKIEFDCFVPKALEPRALTPLLRSKRPLAIVTSAAQLGDEHDVGFVEDGSELAKIIRVHAGDRLVRPEPKKRPAPPKPVAAAPTPPPSPQIPPVSERRPAPAPEPEPPKKPKAPHPLRQLNDVLGARVRQLGIRSFQWVIGDGETEPMISFANGQVRIAGENRVLRAVAAELAAGSVKADAAIDALAAHAVNMLNLAFLDITDSNELFALTALLSPRSGDRRQSRRSS